jgi:hypothetical protein
MKYKVPRVIVKRSGKNKFLSVIAIPRKFLYYNVINLIRII